MKKTAIVTGANSGMGKATTLALMNKDYHVIMACRSQSRGQRALDEVTNQAKSGSCDLYICDLSSLTSIKEFSDQVHQNFNSLDLLINNAGVILTSRQETAQGFEMQLGVNHVGHFYLTKLVLDLLQEKRAARIVNVSSGAHKAGKIDFKDIHMEKGYGTFKAYSRSKLANILFTRELAKRLEGTVVTVNACHPGAVGTSMGVNRETGFGKGLLRFLGLFFLTPEQGADTAVFLATSDEVAGVSGQYFYKRKPAKISKIAANDLIAQKLWTVTEMLIEPYS